MTFTSRCQTVGTRLLARERTTCGAIMHVMRTNKYSQDGNVILRKTYTPRNSFMDNWISKNC